jgi:hypothetical protein
MAQTEHLARQALLELMAPTDNPGCKGTSERLGFPDHKADKEDKEPREQPAQTEPQEHQDRKEPKEQQDLPETPPAFQATSVMLDFPETKDNAAIQPRREMQAHLELQECPECLECLEPLEPLEVLELLVDKVLKAFPVFSASREARALLG